MSSRYAADIGQMARWGLFTNHMHVLTALAQRPDLRLREIAQEVGITERGTHRIISELVEEGYLTRERIGSRNRYEIHEDLALRHPLHARCSLGQVMRVLSAGEEPSATGGAGLDETQPSEPRGSETYRQAFAAAPAGMVLVDASGCFLAANSAYCSMLGYREDELLGRTFRAAMHPDDVAAGHDGFDELLAGEPAGYTRERRLLHRDGSIAWVKLRVAATVDPATQAPLFVAHVIDIGARKRQEESLAEAEERFNSAFDNAPIGMSLVAPDGRWLKVNRSLCELTGHAETALLLRSLQSITHPDDLDASLAGVEDVLEGRRPTYQMETRYYHADGHVIWVRLSVSLVRDASRRPSYVICQTEDISEHKQREQALRDHAEQQSVLASTDPLTGLSTRRAWDLAIAERMSLAADLDEPLAVALIDLDGLREINLTHGADAGHEALRAFAAPLRASLRDGDVIARFGGHELAIFIPATSTENMLIIAERSVNALPSAQGASAGVAIWDGQETTATLLGRADRALRAAKRAGRGQVLLADTGPARSRR
jgi:PAS domain S-box-containing protein/diguanylate cyclase (GGDEF)-like protein